MLNSKPRILSSQNRILTSKKQFLPANIPCSLPANYPTSSGSINKNCNLLYPKMVNNHNDGLTNIDSGLQSHASTR